MDRMSKNTEIRNIHDEVKKYVTVQSDKGNLIGFDAEPFWKNHPNLWFQKIEAQLSNCNIEVDTRKFNFVISLLDEETALVVKDIIIEPPNFNKYDFLKEQLIKRITAHNEQEARKRMMKEPMGERKPSEFYCHLSVLAGCYVSDDFVENVWLDCLPRKIRLVVDCLKHYELPTLTNVADRVYEVFFSAPINQPTNTPAASVMMEALVKEVENLNKKIQTFKPKGTPCKIEPRSKGQDVQCPPSKSQNNATHQMAQYKPCPYHTKYGVKLCKLRKNRQ